MRPRSRALCTERVANRPIVCHALDTLVSAGITELAVVAPPTALEAIRACVENDGAAGADGQVPGPDKPSGPSGVARGRSPVRGRRPGRRTPRRWPGRRATGQVLAIPRRGAGRPSAARSPQLRGARRTGTGDRASARRNRVERLPQPSVRGGSLRVWTRSSPPCVHRARGSRQPFRPDRGRRVAGQPRAQASGRIRPELATLSRRFTRPAGAQPARARSACP